MYEPEDGPTNIVVPNEHPSFNAPYRIAFVGEAPGRDEELERKPFVGMSGRFLMSIMARAGITRQACFIGNICQHRPPANEIAAFSWDGPEITDGLKQLKADIAKFNPNLIVLLGNTALKAAKDPVNPHYLKKFLYNVDSYRGTVFQCDHVGSPFFGYICMATYHPAAVLRVYDWLPALQFDLRRARKQGELKTIPRLDRLFQTPRNSHEIVDWLQSAKGKTCAVDIEGGVDGMTCISVATSPTHAFIVPFNGEFILPTTQDEARAWRALADFLEDTTTPKILQNSLYDRFVLQYTYGITVRNIVDDTMLKHWELFCEMEKSLAFQTSIYTNEPYYKFERKTQNRQTHWDYCCKDAAVTHEINQILAGQLTGERLKHYHFNLALLEPLLYMELRGMLYNTTGAITRQAEVQTLVYQDKFELDSITGKGVRGNSEPWERMAMVRTLMCKKSNPNEPLKPYIDVIDRALALAKRPSAELTPAEQAELSSLLEVDMNVDSPKFKTYLYNELKLPIQTNDEGKATADYEALLNLVKKTDHPVPKLAIKMRHNQVRARMLSIKADLDNRIRCGYNIVGTETGRLSCYKSPTGSGYNLQTIPTYDRDLFIADPGHYLFQCDLSGADGWTVAAHCAALGDRTMLDDYLYGIKPAKVLCYMLRHGASSITSRTPRDEIVALTKEVKKEDWDYFLCKIGQHGTCYLMGERALQMNCFLQSEGRIMPQLTEIRNLQNLFITRYQIKRWHDNTARNLAKKPQLTSASGHVRHFFGRAKEILGTALAHEPQANTTYATNLAAVRLWTDPENRMLPNPAQSNEHIPLRIEPLHQVHDALVGQFKIEDTSWAVGKIKSYFDNPITIAGIKITIPFEGAYGASWGKTDVGTI